MKTNPQILLPSLILPILLPALVALGQPAQNPATPVFTNAAQVKAEFRSRYFFTNAAEAKAFFKVEEMKHQDEILQKVRDRGASPAEINANKDFFQRLNSNSLIKTWSDWTNSFHPQILNPPMIFDARDPFPPDFSTLGSAYRSYCRALRAGDEEALLNNSDESEQAWLKRYLKVERGVKRSTYETFTNLTHFTILLTASTVFEGRDYHLVLARGEEHTHPKAGIVVFRVVIFRRTGNGFVLSRDLDMLSAFGGVTQAAGASLVSLLPYPKFYEKASKSDFPPHFYTIE